VRTARSPPTREPEQQWQQVQHQQRQQCYKQALRRVVCAFSVRLSLICQMGKRQRGGGGGTFIIIITTHCSNSQAPEGEYVRYSHRAQLCGGGAHTYGMRLVFAVASA
jgi:hypothetical protein